MKLPHFQDFYKKKERRLASRPPYIQETFELCAEDMNKRLLVYQSQCHEYHQSCVQGEPLCYIMQKLIQAFIISRPCIVKDHCPAASLTEHQIVQCERVCVLIRK